MTSYNAASTSISPLLERLIDKRFQGVAKGVGTQKIIGRVHQAPVKIRNVLMPCMITGRDLLRFDRLDLLHVSRQF